MDDRTNQETRYVPGMRVEIRDAEWRVERVERASHGGMLLTCRGHSELVRGRTGMFLTELENDIRILSPETTVLVDDLSTGYIATQLYLDTLLRTAPPTDGRIHVGHRGAMDLLPFQLDPALQALAQPRPRILIADSVGLGKTLEAGILVSELIRRGRGKRILVLAVKSMLAQFQREFWQRFTIPLVRLDSVGLQRVRNNIPANHNPFHYFDRAIISIDTLKQTLEYRDHLEQAYWDIVIIDEAHNVAKRSNRSLRHRLAQLVSTRSETLIMLSATPHDGKPESFASLINMLDPTAIANPTDYAHEDYRDKGLVVRRFKQHVAAQLAAGLPERIVDKRVGPATATENNAFTAVREATFSTLNGRGQGAGQLFRTTLEKTLLSSPAACLSTVENRLQRLAKRKSDKQVESDVTSLEAIRQACRTVTVTDFSKYQLLVAMLSPEHERGINWNPKDSNDRIVIFTESLVTLDFLAEHLAKDLGLKAKQVAILKGTMRDQDLMETVNAFNQPQSPLRLLVCSDVASEGLNLHHCSHRLIHFDVPWSLMVFQQRNGRIDRYGQKVQPEIYYLLSETSDEKVRGDQRVLEVLIQKDDQASRNLGDPSEFTGAESIAEEEEITAAIIERDDVDPDDLSHLLDEFLEETGKKAESGLSKFASNRAPSTHADLATITAKSRTVFADDLMFATTALRWLSTLRPKLKWNADGAHIDLEAPADLQQRAKFLPREAQPENYRFLLTTDIAEVQAESDLARDEESASFGRLQYLWAQHPVMEWLMQTVQDAFGRHTAPVMRLSGALQSDEHWVIAHGGFPNKRGQALIQAQVGVHFERDAVTELLPLEEVIGRLKLNGAARPNPQRSTDCEPLSLFLQDAVTQMRNYLRRERENIEGEQSAARNELKDALDVLRDGHVEQLELDLGSSGKPDTFKQAERKRRMDHIVRVFDEYERWIEDTHRTEDDPYIQVVAVITGDSGGPG